MNMHCSIKKSKNLILFFSGFGGHYSHFIPFLPKDYDFVIFYDYRDFSFDEDKFLALLKDYEKITLCAFSMGVWVANMLINALDCEKKITKKIAINGTEYGIHDDFGIPKRLFLLTAKNFHLEYFQKVLFGKNPYDTFIFLSENELKDELNSLYKNHKEPLKFLAYDEVFISQKDSIFSFENQKRFWENRAKIHFVDAPHFAFFALKELLCF